MQMYNLVECSDNYSKPLGSLWKYYRDDPALTDDGAIDHLPGNSASFKSKVKITGETLAAGNTKDLKIAVPLKY